MICWSGKTGVIPSEQGERIEYLKTMNGPLIHGLIVTTVLSLVGCTSYVIPKPLADQVDHTILFDQLKNNPEAYKGKLVALGGEILDAQNLKEGTLLELLQLPLDRSNQPEEDLNRSQGRFLLLHPGYLETAIYHKGRFITAIGEVVGAKVQPIGEMDYTYPYLTAKFIHLWAATPRYAYPPYYSPPHPYRCSYPWPPPYGWDPFCYPWEPPAGYRPFIRPHDSMKDRQPKERTGRDATKEARILEG